MLGLMSNEGVVILEVEVGRLVVSACAMIEVWWVWGMEVSRLDAPMLAASRLEVVFLLAPCCTPVQ